MSISPRVVEHFMDRLGQSQREAVGRIEKDSIWRYSTACGETDPIYYDPVIARERGFDGLVAPPNYLAAMADWDRGVAERDLNIDGTPIAGRFGRIPEGVVALGGSESLEFHQTVIADMVVDHQMTVTNVDSKLSKSGDEMCLVGFEDQYATADGVLLTVARRTVILK